MSQLIAFKNQSGILLAADSRAPRFTLDGEVEWREGERFQALGKGAAILAGGAPEGAKMIADLAELVESESVTGVEEIYNLALPFLTSAYTEFMRKECEFVPLDPLHHVFFILGGRTGGEAADPFRTYLIWIRRKLPQLDADEIESAFTTPRLIGLEARLARLSRENADLDAVLPDIRGAMEVQAERNEEIAPPFVYARITREGLVRE
jgi:hypothetical protein